MAERTRRGAITGLVVWTLFVWLTRVRNVVSDDDVGVAGQLWGLAISASFVVLACHVLWCMTRQRERLGVATLALAGWTVAVWIVRGVDIATGDHSAGFIAVHLALGLLSIALAALATRSVVRLRDGFSAATARE